MLCRSVNRLFFSSISRKVHNFQTAAHLNKSVRPHEPVMAEEVVSYLSPRPGELYLDMTSGGMGHSQLLLDAAPNVTVLCLDRDPVAYEMAVEMSKKYCKGTVIPLLGRFSELPELLKQQKIHQHSIDGILFDFGCSSMQFDEGDRGFSISKNGPLDMRMDGDRLPNSPTCADILAKIDEHDLARIIKVYGEEKHAKKIARTIIEARHSFKKLETTKELADIVAAACSSGCDDHRLDKLQVITGVNFFLPHCLISSYIFDSSDPHTLRPKPFRPFAYS
jgi:16S rRNA (cytosine(1402)-N(4))-methyltransferase